MAEPRSIMLVGFGHSDAAKLLIERGASIEARDRLGNRPLMLASAHGDMHLVELLLAKGADLLSRNERGQDALVLASIGDRLGCDVRASAWPIFDNDLLTEPLRQPLPHNPGYSVSTAARRKPNDLPHRPRGIGLRPSDARDSRQRDSARGQI
jgi:hypothetical protein